MRWKIQNPKGRVRAFSKLYNMINFPRAQEPFGRSAALIQDRPKSRTVPLGNDFVTETVDILLKYDEESLRQLG